MLSCVVHFLVVSLDFIPFRIWYVIFLSPMEILISYKKERFGQTSSLGAICFFVEEPGKICVTTITLHSRMGKVTHPKPIIPGTSAARQEDFGLGQRYKHANTALGLG